eukprot:SAG22_NODE_1052_length_5802_cov_1.994564_5_plen_431_part_00
MRRGKGPEVQSWTTDPLSPQKMLREAAEHRCHSSGRPVRFDKCACRLLFCPPPAPPPAPASPWQPDAEEEAALEEKMVQKKNEWRIKLQREDELRMQRLEELRRGPALLDSLTPPGSDDESDVLDGGGTHTAPRASTQRPDFAEGALDWSALVSDGNADFPAVPSRSDIAAARVSPRVGTSRRSRTVQEYLDDCGSHSEEDSEGTDGDGYDSDGYKLPLSANPNGWIQKSAAEPPQSRQQRRNQPQSPEPERDKAADAAHGGGSSDRLTELQQMFASLKPELRRAVPAGTRQHHRESQMPPREDATDSAAGAGAAVAGAAPAAAVPLSRRARLSESFLGSPAASAAAGPLDLSTDRQWLRAQIQELRRDPMISMAAEAEQQQSAGIGQSDDLAGAGAEAEPPPPPPPDLDDSLAPPSWDELQQFICKVSS